MRTDRVHGAFTGITALDFRAWQHTAAMLTACSSVLRVNTLPDELVQVTVP